MARDDWFRNKTWNEAVEAEFRQRLGRARSSKSQYLRIQAGYLADRYPNVALSLLAEYFAMGEDFDHAQAYVDKARAFVALNQVSDAVASYRAALAHEEEFPNLQTQAYLDYVCLIADAEMTIFYLEGLEVLDTHQSRLLFPVDRYRAYGAQAIFLHGLGRSGEAHVAACKAIHASNEAQSGFRYHQHLGLVEQKDDNFGKRVANLARLHRA